MESIAIIVKEEDIGPVVTNAAATSTATDATNPIAVNDEIVPPIKLDNGMIMNTDGVEYVVDSELAVVPNKTAITDNASANTKKVEEDQLNIAMASSTISNNEVDEIKHNLGEKSEPNGSTETPAVIHVSDQLSSTNNKNYFKRPSTVSPITKEKGAQVNRDSPSTAPHSNFFQRKPPQQNVNYYNRHRNCKQQHYNSGQGHNQQHQNSSFSAPPSRFFRKKNAEHNASTESPAVVEVSDQLSSTNNKNYFKRPSTVSPITKEKGAQVNRDSPSTAPHSNFFQRKPPQQNVGYHNRHRNFKQQHYNSGQGQNQQHQNGLVVQDQQVQSLQQIHHGKVLNHNTGMVMAAADPSTYHHQMYAPQVATVPAAGNTDHQNVATVAAAVAIALRMLEARPAVYQPVLTGATGVTSPPSGTQSLQQPETFMTTYHQPQQQPQQQLSPRSVNLAIPIVAPTTEPNQQQGNLKTNLSTTPPSPTASRS